MSIMEGDYSVKDAASEIGITAGRLRQMIRGFYDRCPSGRGKPADYECKAVKVISDMFPVGHAWQVPSEEVERLKGIERRIGGRPRISDEE